MADELFSSGMPSERDVQRLRVEALGEPGQRRFRLMAVINGETHIVWMEKQQMQALGMAVEQLLEQVSHNEIPVVESNSAVEFDQETLNQFRVGRIELGYDPSNERVVINAYDLQQEDEDAQATLVLRLNLRQSAELSTDAAVIVAAGRPLCPMCGQPMNPEGHVCPQQNGHLPISLDDEDLMEEM
ncbi:MAG: DUF3090 domain-containing protein [Chloroflexota bacterium]|nr:DUF3090 domain-containing protein [Chloroflexota bacterium]